MSLSHHCNSEDEWFPRDRASYRFLALLDRINLILYGLLTKKAPWSVMGTLTS
jgi:hypothetical protein